jgi:uncharacterized protein (TIGR03492 family)
MRLLCLSNGHGEDAIALRILQALQQQPNPPKIAALPLVGEGQAYTHHSIPLAGTVKTMPSGGFVYMDGRQLARDLQGGLVQLTWTQIQTVREWARQGGTILAVGDIVPLLFAWWSGASYAFVGTAKSEYYLRDEHGVLPRQSWFEQFEQKLGSVYLPWERWLMQHPRCKAVFPRDRLTATVLQRHGIAAFDLGNPMMDGLQPDGALGWGEGSPDLTIALLPGSRIPEAYENWQQILLAVSSLLAACPTRSLLCLAALAPSLETAPLQQALIAQGWQRTGAPDTNLPFVFEQPDLVFEQPDRSPGVQLILTSAFNVCLHQADLAIATAGTATEQFVGLGKPAITLPGQGPQFTIAFAEAQTRLLGPSVILLEHPAHIARVVPELMQNSQRLEQIRENGYRRMGQAGAAERIAACLRQVLHGESA